MVNQAQVGVNMTRVALVHFSSSDHRTGVAFNLDMYTSAQQVANAINAIDIDAIVGVSDLDLGLYITRTQVFGTSQSPGLNNVVLISEGL